MPLRGFSSWFLLGVLVTTGLMMMTFGVLFIRSMMTSSLSGVGIFALLLLGIVLLLTGGGLLSSTVAESIRRWRKS